jgi:poly(A) polymerase
MDLPRTPIQGHLDALTAAFAAQGHRLYLVGGPVRDHILRRAIHDVDLTTAATPDEIRRVASKVNPSAIYDVGARFGTIGMIFHAPDGQPWPVEVTTFRTEQYTGGTRNPEVRFGTSLDDDLRRRDFTMNAIAVDLHDGSEHDPTGGREAIEAGVIAAVGDAVTRFREDPLRLLRAVRFTSQLGFQIEPVTEEAIVECAPELARISRERVAAELNLILMSDSASSGIRRATELGLMADAIPELLPMLATSQRPNGQHKDVFEHTMGVLDNLDGGDLGLRWAALLHDVGKPPTKTVHDGVVHFIGHEEVGARMAQRVLSRLHFDRALVARVVALIRNHLRINAYEAAWTDSAVRRLIREVDPYLDDLIKLSRADVTSYRREKRDAAAGRVDRFEQRCAELQAAQNIPRLRCPIDGDELMVLLGRPPGPWIRQVKDYLLGLVLDGELDEGDVKAARDLAKAYVEEREGRRDG